MDTINQNLPIIYPVGNAWQRDRYAFMSEYNRNAGITEFGTANRGNHKYFHIITEKDRLHNFLGEQEILDEAITRNSHHKLGDFQRLLTNTVASQTCCFNLFAPLKNRQDLASKLFSYLMGKKVQIRHIEIEFTPYKHQCDDRRLDGFPFSNDETLGDQSSYAGTDADVAVFYTYGDDKGGVILIEFKYIEPEFSTCSSFKKKKEIRAKCNSQNFYQVLIESNPNKTNPKALCGYLKYRNWQLLEKSMVFNLQSIKEAEYCPFRFSLQQLWRNLLLAENVAKVRNLDEFHFWVVCPSQNKWLWHQHGSDDVESELRSILTPLANKVFSRQDIKKDFVDNLKVMAKDSWVKQWIRKFEDRYC